MVLDNNRLNCYYVTLGTKELVHELMQPATAYEITNSSKPSGGVWLTEDTGNIDSNFWIDYLLREGIGYKFSNNACYVKLKETAKILVIKSYFDFLKIQAKYHVVSNRFNGNNLLVDYHKLSNDYDGLLLSEDLLYNFKINSLFYDWRVESLVLFNLNCIEFIKPFEIVKTTTPYGYEHVEIKKEYDEKTIKPINPKYVELFNEFNEKGLKAISNSSLENLSVMTRWDFRYNLFEVLNTCVENNPALIKEITKLLNTEVLDYPIDSQRVENPLIMQLENENYDYIEGIYKRALKK